MGAPDTITDAAQIAHDLVMRRTNGDVENTYIHPSNNGRICRQCARERDRQPNRNATYRRQMKKLKQMEEA